MRRVELGIGLQLAVGGHTGRARAALMAAGVALGVAVLLLAASVPHMINAHDARVNARAPVFGSGHSPLRLATEDGAFRGQNITGQTLQPVGPNPPVPPGIPRLPVRGEMYVSPALAAMLHGPGGSELQRRLNARVVGTISTNGLGGPHEALFIRGATGLAGHGILADVTSFGVGGQASYRSPLITLLTIVIVVALLLPVAVFVVTAARFGAEDRDRRLAAVRLVGADARGAAWVAAGEVLPSAGAGLLLGAAAFLASRPLMSHVTFAGIDVFTGDVSPSAVLTVLVAVLVPLTAVVATLSGIRRIAIEPLGTSGRGLRARRRLLWRLIAPGLGFLLLLEFLHSNARLGGASGQVQAAFGVALVLIGITSVLPWVVERVVRHAPDGPVPWLLAVRRLRQEEGTTVRVIAAIALTVAGAIALAMLFGAAEAENHRLSPAIGPGRFAVSFQDPAQPTGRGATCATLEHLAPLSSCGTGAAAGYDESRGPHGMKTAVVRLRDPAASDRLRDGIAAIDPLAQVVDLQTTGEDGTLRNLRHALDAGAVVVLMMIGLSLLVAAAEQLRDRRRALADLSAVGARRSTVAWSMLWQAAIPVLTGLALAIAMGLALGALLSGIVNLSPDYDWGGIALMSAAAAAVVAVVTTLSLPGLWRAMGPEALWTE